MLILFDHGHAHPLPSFLPHHTGKKTQELGWDTLNNGELLRAAEDAAFEVFLTTDKNIRYQQNPAERVIAIVVLGNSRWPLVQRHVDCVVAAISAAKPGTYTEVEIPDS
jgi:hypothetical protein